MKKLFLILFLFPVILQAQTLYPTQIIGSDTMFSNMAGDSLFKNRVFYFKTVTKRYIDWNIIRNRPSTYTAAAHSHTFSDVTGLQAALDAKGTSSFDGVYSSLSGKPTLFDGAYSSLTGKPTLFDGTYSSLTGKPSTFTPASHSHVKADISDFPTTTAGFSNSTNKNFVTDAQQTVIGNTSGTNTGDNAANSTYASDYRAANFVAGTNYLAPNGNGSALTGLTASQVSLSNVTNTSDANKPVSTAQQTALDLKANLSTTPQIVASINATAQTANIATATLYAVPSAGFYRVSIYIAVTQAATTSSTMPSTTITYTDGNAGTNSHSTTTTATSTGNSVTTTFAQTTYVLYAKASTNIQYATGSYATSGATGMQYALRIRVETL